MNKETFLKDYFEIFTDENGNSVGRGSSENAWIALEYEQSVKSIPIEFICSKWKAYIDDCIQNKVQDRYIMGFENFISKGKYNESFGGSLKTKQISFLDKYKTSTEDVFKTRMIKYILELPEGDFGIEFDNSEQQNKFVNLIKSNNCDFVDRKGFVIIQLTENEFSKKLLKYVIQ